MKKPTRPISYEAARQRAGALIARSEQCSPQLLKMFDKWGLPPSDAQRLLAELIKLGWVDDSRYARAFAHDKILFSGWGKAKVTAALYAKRLSREAISQAFEEISDEEYNAVALKAIRAKLRSLSTPVSDYDTRAKLYRFGLSRGFESSLVGKVIAFLQKLADQEANGE